MTELSTAASAASAASQLPFWLQVASISLAPILGFIGIGVGVFLSERNRRTAYVRDERRKAYLEYLELLSQLTAMHGTEFKTAIRTGNSERIIELAVRRRTFEEKIHKTTLQIRLIGSPATIAAAQELMTYHGLATSLIGRGMKGTFSNDDWTRLIKFGFDIQSNFTEMARADLELPRRERHLPKLAREESADSYEKFSLESINLLLDEIGSEAPPPDT